MKSIIKNFLKKTLLKPNKIYPIFKGPLKGYKFKVTLNTEWSPIIGNWEPESQYLFDKLIKNGQTIFDLGANTGIHTLLFSKLAGTKGKVIAFEPLNDNIHEIQENLSINKFTNVKIEPLAISNYVGETSFKLGINNKRGSLVGIGHETGVTQTVKVDSLDNYIERTNTFPDFIKIDIEGAEKDAIEGFEKSVSKNYPILYIESHDLSNEKIVSSFLNRHSYVIYQLSNDADNDLGLKYLKKTTAKDRLFPMEKNGSGTVIAIHSSKMDSVKKILKIK
jgi:FkbM family methyltransferase